MTKFSNNIILLIISLLLSSCATKINTYSIVLLKEVLIFEQIHQGNFQDLRIIKRPNQQLEVGTVVETDARTIKTLSFTGVFNDKVSDGITNVTLMPNTRIKIASFGIKLLTNHNKQSHVFIEHKSRQLFTTETKYIKIMPTGTKYFIKAFQQNVSINVIEGSTRLFSNNQVWQPKLVNKHESANVSWTDKPVIKPMSVAKINKIIHPITQMERIIVNKLVAQKTTLPVLPPPPVIIKQHFSPPTPTQIKKWWNTKESYSLDEMKHIYLFGGESAYLASIKFKNRGRCCNIGGILIRPKLKRIKEVEGFRTFKVMDLDKNNVSEVETYGSFMGQGILGERSKLVYFKEWKMILLHDSDVYGNNLLTDCEEKFINSECYENKVQWNYQDLNGDGSLELIEKKIEKKWHKKSDIKTTITTNYFTLKNLKLIPFKPSVEKLTTKQDKISVSQLEGTWKLTFEDDEKVEIKSFQTIQFKKGGIVTFANSDSEVTAKGNWQKNRKSISFDINFDINNYFVFEGIINGKTISGNYSDPKNKIYKWTAHYVGQKEPNLLTSAFFCKKQGAKICLIGHFDPNLPVTLLEGNRSKTCAATTGDKFRYEEDNGIYVSFNATKLTNIKCQNTKYILAALVGKSQSSVNYNLLKMKKVNNNLFLKQLDMVVEKSGILSPNIKRIGLTH